MGNYPSEEELRAIRNWDTIHDPLGLVEFVRDVWWNPDWGFKKTKHKLELHTGGWSGNEDIINALKENTMFWWVYWETSKRGGHYWFDDRVVAEKWK